MADLGVAGRLAGEGFLSGSGEPDLAPPAAQFSPTGVARHRLCSGRTEVKEDGRKKGCKGEMDFTFHFPVTAPVRGLPAVDSPPSQQL